MQPQLPPRSGVLLLGATFVLSLVTLGAQDKKREHGFPGIKLSQKFTRGMSIPTALGNRIGEVAKAYGKTEFEFRMLCSKDRNSLHADVDARLLYICAALPAIATQPGTPAGGITKPSYPLSETFFLNSNLNASKTIYLDFTGHTTTNTVWNNSITAGQDIDTPSYDIDGIPSSFSDAELANIQDIWKRVAEDYAPFNVNVTTREPNDDDLRKNSDDDIFYGIRVVIGGNSNWFGSAAGGVAYLGSFDWSSDTPAFVFPAQLGNGHPKYVGEAVSHEVGHSFGLNHDGTSAVEYYQGHANWAPIMGVAYYQPVSHWSKGEYSGANNTEDDAAIIAQEVNYRTDAHGNTTLNATAINGPALSAEGVIETRTDVDVFKFHAGAGTATFNVTPDNVSPNLDVQLRLFNGVGTLLATANVTTTLNATLIKSLAQGTYYLEVDGVGTGTATRAYNDYGSLGQYRLSGTVAPVVGQPPVAVAQQSTPLSGIAPVTVTFSSVGSYDPDGTIRSYLWKFGDGGSATTQTAAHLYSTPGTYTATLTVTDNSGLSATDSVVVVVSPPPPVFVSNIDVSLFEAPYAKFYAGAAVTITDQNGTPVPNATVAGTWSGLVKGSYTAKTDGNGVARFNSPLTSSRGTFTFTVTGITATGYKYDATKNKETKDSVTRL
jgi:PKD repeat protein